ncbi:MAG: hypothetical protein HY259_07040 [Chloroflexi bacterium]|nr:hypothetical protein [Chloroflexota bacterium]
MTVPIGLSASAQAAAGRRYMRPATAEDALQIAIEKWVRFEYQVWRQARERPIGRLEFGGTIFRLLTIGLSVTLTTLANLPEFSRDYLTILGGVLTAVTAMDAYFRLGDRKVTNETRKQELLTLRDEWNDRWAVQVQMETDSAKALEAAKKLLVEAQVEVDQTLNKYASRNASAPNTKPQ